MREGEDAIAIWPGVCGDYSGRNYKCLLNTRRGRLLHHPMGGLAHCTIRMCCADCVGVGQANGGAEEQKDA